MPVAGAGVLTVIVPVAIVQVGWVRVADGCAGVAGGALIVTLCAGDMQPSMFLNVTL